MGIKISDLSEAEHAVFLTPEKTLVILSIYKGEIELYENSISPKPLKLIGKFEADGHSDFNWGVVGFAIEHKIPALLKKALKIDRHGL